MNKALMPSSKSIKFDRHCRQFTHIQTYKNNFIPTNYVVNTTNKPIKTD